MVQSSKSQLQTIYDGAKVLFGQAVTQLDNMMKDLNQYLDNFSKKTIKTLQDTSENCKKHIQEVAKKTEKSIK